MRTLLLLVVMAGVGLNVAPRNTTPSSSTSGMLVVANQIEHTLLVVDPQSRREISKVVVGVNGHEVVLSKDGRLAYVPIYSNAQDCRNHRPGQADASASSAVWSGWNVVRLCGVVESY